MTLDIKLDDSQLAQIVGKQILDSMGDAAREKLITDAIVWLNKAPEYRGYGDKPLSPIQHAFNVAVGQVVNELVKELVQTSEVRAQIEAAASRFIKIFPDAYAEQALQEKVMATIVEHAREVSTRL